jgi:hypothetical protein
MNLAEGNQQHRQASELDSSQEDGHESSSRVPRVAKPVTTGKQIQLFDDDELEELGSTTPSQPSGSYHTKDSAAFNQATVDYSYNKGRSDEARTFHKSFERGDDQSGSAAGSKSRNHDTHSADEDPVTEKSTRHQDESTTDDPAQALRKQRIAQRAARLKKNEEKEVHRQVEVGRERLPPAPKKVVSACFAKDTGLVVETSKMDHREVFGERASVADGLLDGGTRAPRKTAGSAVSGALDLDAGSLARSRQGTKAARFSDAAVEDRRMFQPVKTLTRTHKESASSHMHAHVQPDRHARDQHEASHPEPEKRYNRHKLPPPSAETLRYAPHACPKLRTTTSAVELPLMMTQAR